MTSKEDIESWLGALSEVEGTDVLLSRIRQEYYILLFKVGTTLFSGNRVQDFAVSLGIHSDVIQNVIAITWPPADALIEVLLHWCKYSLGLSQPPKLDDLEFMLHDHPVAAMELTQKIEEVCDVELPFNSTNNNPKIIDQTTDFRLHEGRSALLEVQVEGHLEGYEWCLYEKTIPENKESILSLFAVDLLSEGEYTCKIGKFGQDTPLVSKPIHITVRTTLDTYQNVLFDRYIVQPEVPVDTRPPEGGITFINLALIKQESIQKVGEFGHGTIRGDMDDILQDKQSITYEKALANLSSGMLLLIEGRPGSGKTTLMHKFSQDWAKMEMKIHHVRLLLLVHLRGFLDNPNIELHDIIDCYYKYHPGRESILKYAMAWGFASFWMA